VHKKISNLRSIDNYLNKDGKKMKSKLLYRSGSLNIDYQVLTDTLNSLNIQTVFDLRSNYEVHKDSYNLPHHIKYYHYPVLSSLEGLFKDVNFDLSSVKEASKLMGDNKMMIGIYQEMALNPAMFGLIIKDIITEARKPLLFHCSAGKDRTGILASFLLLSLDISYDDIRKEYLLTNEYIKDQVELEINKLRSLNLQEEEINKIKDMLIVKEEYINSFLNVIKQYNSFRDYAQEKLNLDNSDLQKLKDLFLQ